MSNTNILLPICVDDKWGYINLRGEVAVPSQYDYASTFSEGLATVRIYFDYEKYENHEIMVINSHLNEIGRLVCAHWGEYSEGLMVFGRNDKRGYVDTSLQVAIPPSFDDAGDFVDGLAWAQANTNIKSQPGVVDRPEGIIGRSGNWAIRPQYSRLLPFKKGERVTAFQASIPVERVYRRLPPHFDLPRALIEYNNARADELSVKEASIASGLERIRPAPDDPNDLAALGDWYRYVCGEPPSDKIAWGLLDRLGDVIVEPSFESIGWPNQGMLAAGTHVGGKYKEGIIDERGDWLVKPQWDDTDGGFTDDLMSAAVKGKWGLVNREGEWVIKPQYTNARKFSNGLCGVYVGGRRDSDYGLCDGKYGFINKAGKMVIEPRIDDVSEFEDGICKVVLIDGDPKDNLRRLGYIDEQGRYIWEPSR